MAPVSPTLLPYLAILLQTVHSAPWVGTEYHEYVVGARTETILGGIFRYTNTIDAIVTPTGDFKAISTTTKTVNNYAEDLTLAQIYLATDAQLVTTPAVYGNCESGACDRPTSTGPTTNYFAEMTVVAAKCTPVISYVTTVPVFPPSQAVAGLSITSSTSFVTTSLSDAYVSTATTIWTEVDLYLATGQANPFLNAEASSSLDRCQDPRGTATGITSQGGPKETGKGKEGAGSRVRGEVGGGWWVLCGVWGVGVLVGGMLVL